MKNKLKAIGILMSLSLLWYGLYFAASFYNGVNAVDSVEIETGVVQEMNNTVTEVVWGDIEPIEGTCPECEGVESVLGDDDGEIFTCEDVLNELITTPVIISGSGKVDYRGGSSSGDRVSKDAEIIVEKVTVPAVLLAGSSQVKDSNQLISMESGSLKAAGNIFAVDYGRQLESPASAVEYDSHVNNTVYKERFGSETEMNFSQAEGEGSVAKVNIETEEESICLDCQNSNYNPDKSNTIAQEINYTLSIPGGQDSAPQDEEEILTDSSGFFEELPKAATEEGCTRDVSTGLFTLFKTIAASVFNRCEAKDEEGNYLYPNECIFVENIYIRTNSFFGNYETCSSEGECTNTLLSRRSLLTSSPTTASTYDQDFLVTTPCDVNIDGKTYTVKCLWDVSYIAKEYYYQWQNSNPGEELPDWSVYWESIENDILGRDTVGSEV